MVSLGQAARPHPLSAASWPTGCLQAASFAVHAASAYAGADADVVCPSLDYQSDP